MIAQAETRQARIAERLAGEHILVTGSTGFLAKIFVEKLLRSVPDVGSICLLVRPRADGTAAGQRVRRDVIGSSAFDRLRAVLGPGFEEYWRSKIDVVSGDLTQDRLGLSKKNYAALARRVTVVVNSAATVTFDERLDAALALNVEGPRRLLRFAKDAGNVPFLHVSTAYVSGVRRGDIPEELTPAGHSVASYIDSKNGKPDVAADFDIEQTLARLYGKVEDVVAEHGGAGSRARRDLIAVGMDYAQEHGWNDTYTCTKWLAEQFLARDRDQVPLVLLRPAIIEGSYDEPAPGWIDGLRMADPLILAFGRGKLKEFPADKSVALDFIPVDFVANAMVAVLPAGRKKPMLEVYQCASSGRNPVRMTEIIRSVSQAFRKRPMRDDSGRPIRVSDMQCIPRDEFLRRWQRRLKFIRRMRGFLKSTKIAPRYRKKLASVEAQVAQLIYFVKIYAPYTHLDCRFLDDKLHSVFESMHPEDQKQFSFDVARIDWRDYIVNRHVVGVRHFVLGSGTELEAPMLAAGYAVEEESPAAPSPMQVLAPLRGESIFSVIENAAVRYPKRIALQVCRDGRWTRCTYKQLLNTTAAVSRRFQEQGLSQGDHIAIYCENGPEWGLTYIAAMRSGLTVVPLDKQLPASTAVGMAEFADVKLFCAAPGVLKDIQSAVDAESTMKIVALDATFVPPPGTARDPGPEPASVPGDAVASIVFTSGTTLAPKGVMLRHANFLANARSLVHVQSVHADDQFLSVLPMHHVFEFTGGFLVPLSNASTVTYVENLNATEILETMQATGTTVMMVVPRLLKLFHDGIMREVDNRGWLARKVFSLLGWIGDRAGGELCKKLFAPVHKKFGGRLRMFVCGGSALPSWLFLAFRRLGFPVYEGYGLTETSPVLTVNPNGDPRAGSVGLPLPETELEIRNQDTSGVGELFVRSPSVMAGYYKNKDATAEVLEEDWFRTGDLCRRDADGFVYVAGRAKDVIVTAAGKNVYPDEVTANYADLPHVKEMCVLAVPNSDGIGDRVDAVVVLNLDEVADVDHGKIETEVRDAVAAAGEKQPSYQRISHLYFWSGELPRTTTLKVKRNEVLRQLLARRTDARSRGRRMGDGWSAEEASAAPQTANEAWLRDTLIRFTNRSPAQVKPEAHLLLDLGVDSLLKVQVLGEIESCFGVDLSDEVAARVSRVADLLAIIGSRTPVNGSSSGKAAWRSKVQGNRNGQPFVNGRTPLLLRPLRWTLRGVIALLCNSYIRVRVEGVENIPKRSAFILAANHASHLDSAVVLAAVSGALRQTSRRCYVAAAEDYFFDSPFKAMIFRDLFDSIPFDRNADGMRGLSRCAEALQQGHAVLLFPEGTRTVTGEIQSFKIGAAVLSSEIGVPVVPVRIANTFDLFPKGRRFIKPGAVEVRFSPPVQPADVDKLSADARYKIYRDVAAEVQHCVESENGRSVLTHV